MDRPEWIDTFPDSLTAIATLTNNSRRGTTPVTNPTARGFSRPPVDAQPARQQRVRPHHHVELRERLHASRPSAGTSSRSAGDPTAPAHGSTIVGDKYGSPDGIYVAPSGRLWIQTDVSGSTINAGAYAGFGNNQMLCADPHTRETRRFLVGPNICEITGVFVTPDEKTMFVGIQHPGRSADGRERSGQSETLQLLARRRRRAAGRARPASSSPRMTAALIGS